LRHTKRRFAVKDEENVRRNGANEIREGTQSIATPRVLRKGALEPAESFFLVAQRGRNSSDQRAERTFSPSLAELSKNISRLDLPAHARVGDGKSAAREMGCLLSFGVRAIASGKFASLDTLRPEPNPDKSNLDRAERPLTS